MSATTALRLAHEHGIRVGVLDGDLVLNAGEKPSADILYALRLNKAGIVALLAADADPWTAEYWQAFFDERAGKKQKNAEAAAFESCVIEWLNRRHTSSDPSRCAACGTADREGHTIVPFGTEDRGHTWLHPECWHEWRRERRREASKFLNSLGIPNPKGTSTERNTR